MKGEEDEENMLIKKIEEQDQVIQKLKVEEGKLVNYIKEFKEALEKKVNKEQQSSQKPQIDEAKLEKQMQKQL